MSDRQKESLQIQKYPLMYEDDIIGKIKTYILYYLKCSGRSLILRLIRPYAKKVTAVNDWLSEWLTGNTSIVNIFNSEKVLKPYYIIRQTKKGYWVSEFFVTNGQTSSSRFKIQEYKYLYGRNWRRWILVPAEVNDDPGHIPGPQCRCYDTSAPVLQDWHFL